MNPGARRVSVRRRLSSGEVGDVVGHVVAETATALTVFPEDRPGVVVPRADVVALRQVPPRVVRPSSGAGDMARLLAGFWPGTESTRLGGWLLRAGGGFTKRANSALADGDPGCERTEALRVVAEWYADRGLPANLYVLGGAADRPDDGWEAFEETDVLSCDLRRAGPAPVPGAAPEDSDTPTSDWLSVWRGGRCDGEVERAVLTAAPARYLLLREGERPVACARVATGRSWVHVSCVEVHPDARGRGLARALMAAAPTAAREVDPPARFAAVEVEAVNGPAQRLYASMGFVRHHRYHYRRFVGAP